MSWNDTKLQKIWEKGAVDPEYDPAMYRKDACGAWMKRTLHGTHEKYGWEVDHIIPVSKGGTDALDNLRPLHWENNRKKQDGTLPC